MRKILVSFVLFLFICSSLFITPISVSAYGTADDLINVAMDEVGNSDGTKYGTSGAWCAAFVSWCARQAGIPTNVIKSTINSRASDFGVPYYTWEDFYSGRYTPSRGDLVFFNWSSSSQKSLADHVGIIRLNPTKSSNYVTITTVEGNMSGRVRSDIVRKVELSTGKITTFDSGYIIGFGKPNYTGALPSNPSQSRPIAPSIVTISSVNGSTIYENENFKISWSGAQNATAYEVCIRSLPSMKVIHRKYGINSSVSSYTYSLPAGQYDVAVITVNSNYPTSLGVNYNYSDFFKFEVKETSRPIAPSVVTISPVNGSTIYENENFKISWSGAQNATAYEVCIRSLPSMKVIHRKYGINSSVSSYTYSLPTGQYDVAVVTVNSNYPTSLGVNYNYSDFFKFEVEEIVQKETTVTSDGAKCIIQIPAYDYQGYKIIVASYKNSSLVTFESRENKENQEKFTVIGDIDEIKVMVWDGLSMIKPLCDAEVIPKSKWIMS